MPYKITNTEKKDVSDKTQWVKVLKNGKKLYLEDEVWYRWGQVLVEEDPRENGWKPGEPLVTDDFNRMDHHLEDGCWTDVHGKEELSKKEQKLIEESYFLDDAGWEAYESEITFYGPVEIEEVENEYLM
jgi:hypothetical protein